MRSAQIHQAITQGNSRFEICQLVSKGVRITHKDGTRMEDSIGSVLGTLAMHPAASRRGLATPVDQLRPDLNETPADLLTYIGSL